MNIIPLMKCKDMEESIFFYTNVLDFTHVGTWPQKGSPSFAILKREGAEMHLSTHSGDGTFGNVVSIVVKDVDDTFKTLLRRGLKTPDKEYSPVHQNPITQTWGTRELYVDDPNGNTIRFVER